MILTATIRDDSGQSIGMLILNETTFASGAGGWRGQGKLTIAGKRYQCQAQAVMIKGQEEPAEGGA